jgi:gliding motility-associated-like protein
MKRIFILSVIMFSAIIVKADHITGGEMHYTFLAIVNGQYQYSVTLKYFMRCNSGRQFYDPTVVSVYNKRTSEYVSDIDVPLSSQTTLSLTDVNPCISNPPTVCYEVGSYNFILSLPASPDGYKLASQVTYRIQGIDNLAAGYTQVGATYTAEIPGFNDVATGPTNSSAIFTGNDLVIVCAENSFSYSFGATDNDGDELRYYFCEAFTHSGGGGGGISGPTGPPPYQPVPYGAPFTGQAPLGSKVSINSKTGLITGIAPAAGVYVVTVCVEEIRNGKMIAVQRKDLQINITPCTIAGAMLLPEYLLCKNTKTINLANLSLSPLVKTYSWTVFDRAGYILGTSNTPAMSHTFADTGVYNIKLVINSGQACSDSTTSIAKVYPGFVPAFTSDGVCFSKPSFFKDGTTSAYGITNSWIWDFGESNTSTDTSNLQNPTFTYPSMGRKYTQLVVSNTVGCRDTLIDYLTIIDKPPLNLAFSDTLICVSDAVQLNAGANGIFSWSPNINIIAANTRAPTVSPTSTTTYYVDMDDNGCVNRDSVKVRVTDHVNLLAMNDTTICEGDTIQLHIISDGFQYSWIPASQVVNSVSANPRVITNRATTYQVTANIGSCSATESILVNTVPYPIADAGADTIICDKSIAHLNARIVGNSFTWSPTASLTNSNTLDPVARPKVTTSYNLIVYDNKGCPKPGLDQVRVTVLPPITAYAGEDTAIITGQPLQLTATGGIRYIWSPTTGLSNTNIANPVASFATAGDSIRYSVQVYNQVGCYETASFLVKIYKTLPSVFVPNAFTPDKDGKNDLLKPIAVGMKQIEYFHVYNRWGQLVFSGAANQHGWDGTIKGKLQGPGTYAWAVKAIDYTGKYYFQKGTAVLLR